MHHSKFRTSEGMISKSRCIHYLINNNLVPVKKTTLYKLSLNVSRNLVHKDATWTDLCKDGRKGYLSPHEMIELILYLKEKTTGGVAYSTSELKREIEAKIRRSFKKKNKLYQLPLAITPSILNAYVSIIKSQNIFNIYSNVTNKTEARSIAEWSIRSTLAYTMVVATSHFIPNVKSNSFHPKKKDLSKQALEMWEIVEECYNEMLGHNETKIDLVPVLPNMVTTTDEVTIFATSTTVNKAETLYVAAKPQELKNEMSSSASRNVYKNKASGDAHCRGVRIVINSTFTAGGLSAPIFVSVFGLSNEEMPGSDIITIEVPGLAVGSHQDVYSSGVGFLTFVRGSGSYGHQNDSDVNDELNCRNEEVDNVEERIFSKESIVAQLYREMVYYPFISHIRKTRYGYDGALEDLPDYLKCVSWMDGCNAQLRLITSETNMEKEKVRNIVCCKHSAARTAVEQAADTGAMFKQLKSIVRTTENLSPSNSSIYHHLQQSFIKLSNNPPDGDAVLLPSHKKKAIILTLSKLPIAASRAYSDHVIKKAFMLNGQLDLENQLVPCLENCLNTYRGNIGGTCLEDGKELIKKLYESVYTKGMVDEKLFDDMRIPKDRNCYGNVVTRDFTIVNENRQRSKCLTSDTQVEERRSLLFEARTAVYQKKLSLYQLEEKEYETNKSCEMKLMSLYDEHIYKTTLDTDNTTVTTTSTTSAPKESFSSFTSMADMLTYTIVKEYKGKINILKCDLKAFVRVRSNRTIKKGKITYLNVPDLKELLLVKAIGMCCNTVKERFYKERPAPPQ